MTVPGGGACEVEVEVVVVVEVTGMPIITVPETDPVYGIIVTVVVPG